MLNNADIYQFRSCQYVNSPKVMTACLKRGNQNANAFVVLVDLCDSLILGEKELQEYTRGILLHE